ncbi:uncharacterized protein [Dermacentor andersoni]|uniref:uncharacterized protein isoform X2 n=1 Tax=Dermacentor andersoni TaxID=34620 RepID=UPI0024173AD9|nr:uncharacterized protein LOC126518743 isoform X2 [Dermacentor andersoni]
MARFAEPPVKASRPGRSQPASRRGTGGLLQYFTNRQLWGDQRQLLPLASRLFPLAHLVSQEVLRSGSHRSKRDVLPLRLLVPMVVRSHATVFLGFLSGAQWLLSYVAEPDRLRELPPLCFYRLQWWFFVPGRPLRLVRETPLFGGHGLEAQLMLSVTQWPCDPTCILVAGCSRLDEELWHVTLVSMPGVKGGEVLHACYQCSSGGSGQPRLLGRGHLLLPMGQELVLLETHQNRGPAESSFCPSAGWSATGLQRQAELGAALLFLSVVPPPRHATVLDLELVADTLAQQLCAEHSLVYEGLLDYDACAAAGASHGAQATLLLAFLLEASSSKCINHHQAVYRTPARSSSLFTSFFIQTARDWNALYPSMPEIASLPVLTGLPGGGKGSYYTSTVLLHWDLETGLHHVAAVGSLSAPGLDMRTEWLPSWWSRPLGAHCWMTNDPVLRGQPLTQLRAGPWRIALT